MNRMIDLEILCEILSGVKTEHKNSLEASSIINEVWKEVLEYSEPKRKKGKWIDTGSGQECSECHEIQYGYDNFRYFCPNCGADMRGGGE